FHSPRGSPIMRAALVLLLSLSGVRSHGSVDEALLLEIKNNPHWNEEYINTCNGDKIGVPGLQCHIYRIFLYTVKVEVRSLDSFLVVLKEFIPSAYTDELLEVIKKEELEIQSTVDKNTGKNTLSAGRNANGTFFPHHEYEISSKIFEHIQQRFPFIEFRMAEQFQVLSYKSGGHYAPHYDYLDYATEEIANRCAWYRGGGNRLMTFLFIMQTAEKGGGTVFPRIGTSVQPEKGDAIVWLNMDAQHEKLKESLHGACPIWEGTKTAATLWMRVRGQELLLPCANEKEFDIEKLVHPTEKQLLYKRDWICDYGCYTE
ncbi:hypothetical protein PMAYCL1PPCAC_07444, partial [Pristionchus mayeri]